MALPYKASRCFARLNTGRAARLERVKHALGYRCTIRSISPGKAASTSLVGVGDGSTTVLVSYTTAVAFFHRGHWVATPYGEYSKTTDRAISDNCPVKVLRLEVADFESALHALLHPEH